MIDLSLLNEAQKAAVIDDSPYLRIIAGAGSGKTRVLTMRVAYLIKEEKVFPTQILAITFTNKAANEMKKRIETMLGDEGIGTRISTIHSLCVRILREDIEALNYPRNFTIVDASDQQSIIKEAYKALDVDRHDISYASALSYISNNKTFKVSPWEAKIQANFDVFEEKRADIYEFYERRLKELKALDFDDLILWTVKLFNDFENIKLKWAKRFHYVLVDEFQDIDHLQYELIKDLSSYHKHLYVVGDPDQTIYTWRGADVKIIMNFERDFPESKTIILNQNYRSTNNILSAANSIIKNNSNRVKKDLFSKSEDGERVHHFTFTSDEEEATFIARKVYELHSKGEDYDEIAVLYRSNYLSRNVEKALMDLRIPYIIYGGLRFYERAEIKDMLCYLRMLISADDLALERIINVPRRGIGLKTIAQIKEEAQGLGLSMYELLKAGKFSKMSPKLAGFVGLIEKWRDLLDKEDLLTLGKRIYRESGYEVMLEENRESEREENVMALLSDLGEYESEEENGLDSYLQNVSLYTDRDSDGENRAVNLMTVHAAKGLEFKTVLITGMSDGIFPSERSLEDGKRGLEEERRLAYVAYTRAKKNLYLLENTGFNFITQTAKQPSRFIKEIDEEYLCDHTSSRIPKPKKETNFLGATSYRENSPSLKAPKLKKGDKVTHDSFGQGIVISIEGSIATIAFAHPHGIKKLLASHPSIKKL